MRIIIGGDVVPTENNIEIFKSGDIKQLIGTELLDILNSCDFSAFNLEVPLTNEETPIKKCGPNLIAPTETVAGLKKISPHFFTLANNHILDQGNAGLASTMAILAANQICYSGAGNNLKEASKSYIKDIDGNRIGIYCCVEHEFSIASHNSPGANPFDPLESLDHIHDLSEECDFLIVLYHGGKELYRYPSPYLQKICRKMVEKGAALVVCQHSHCIGCLEEWMNGTIVYGQGNFLFDLSENDLWKTAILVNVEITKTKRNISYIPIQKEGNGVRIAKDAKAEAILRGFYDRSKEIQDPDFIEKSYNAFSEKYLMTYLSACLGIKGKKIEKNIIYRAINKYLLQGFTKHRIERYFSEQEKLYLINFIECEAHRELFVNAMKEHNSKYATIDNRK